MELVELVELMVKARTCFEDPINNPLKPDPREKCFFSKAADELR